MGEVIFRHRGKVTKRVEFPYNKVATTLLGRLQRIASGMARLASRKAVSRKGSVRYG